MSKVTKYLSGTADVAPVKQANPHVCLVNGCPLPGVYRQTNETSICCVHDDEPALKWAEQTSRIRRHEALWLGALDMTNAPAGTLLAPARMAQLMRAGAPEPKVREGERLTARVYGAQIKGWLLRECKGERDAAPVDRARADTWRSIAALAKEPA